MEASKMDKWLLFMFGLMVGAGICIFSYYATVLL